MKQITYKIISKEYHDDFNTFTLKKGQTYFLLGKNGIGKSTLIKYFKARSGENFYDIEFDVFIPKSIIEKYFSGVKIDKDDLETIISEWKEKLIKISYNNIHNNKNEYFDRIKNEVVNSIIQMNKDTLLVMIEKMLESMNKAISLIDKEMVLINKELDAPILTRNISNNLCISVKDLNRKLNSYKKIRDKMTSVKNKIHNTLDKLSKSSKIDLENLPYLDFYNDLYEPQKELQDIIKKTNKYRTEMLEVFYDNSGEKRFFFEHVLHKVLINIGQYINLNDKYDEYDIDEKNLSNGQKVIKSLENVYIHTQKNNWITGYAFDEPFNSLDSSNIKKARKILDKIPGTKLITSHNTNAISATDLKNVIVMFDYKGKRGIANYTDLKKLTKDDRQGVTEVTDQVNAILNNWFSKYKGNVLIVEGYKDYAILNDKLKDIEVIPMGGAFLVSAAISYYSTKSKKIKFLFDKDVAGNQAASEIARNIPNGNITRVVFGKSKHDNLEELITNQSFGDNKNLKNKLFVEIQEGKYESKVNEIIEIIEKQFQ